MQNKNIRGCVEESKAQLETKKDYTEWQNVDTEDKRDAGRIETTTKDSRTEASIEEIKLETSLQNRHLCYDTEAAIQSLCLFLSKPEQRCWRSVFVRFVCFEFTSMTKATEWLSVKPIVHTADTDKTRLSCPVGVGGVNWIGDKSKTVGDRKFRNWTRLVFAVLSSFEMRRELSFVLSRTSFQFATTSMIWCRQ